ncbi:MAG: zinc ribbon domain-containing protein [Gemmatimonadota bacterium]|nr:zinc ribbon domain-containing protein [Gemmatimonadota bacterium]MDH3422521.1 zinc ribbon domain-containing protein [Gemmatimonadota bacterium]
MSSSATGPFCPECDRPATGNFCQHCGANLGGRFCNQCGGKVSAGAQFCNKCGAKVGGGSRVGAHREAAATVVGGQNLAWWVAGAAMFVLILFVGVSMVRPGPGPTPTSTSTPPPQAGAGVAPDISSMSPIEAADRLFNRVMQAVSQGDSAQAQAFMPMAIAAYQRARPLSLDGLFHLSMLNRTAMNLEAALDQALEIVELDPNHLLGRAAAAEAAIELGDLEEAEVHYRRILEVYDDEVLRPLEEYEMHSTIVVELKNDAERFLAGR